MRRVKMPDASPSDAESFIAQLWYYLEKHRIASPDIDIAAGPKASISISLKFADPSHATLAWQAWSDVKVGATGR